MSDGMNVIRQPTSTSALMVMRFKRIPHDPLTISGLIKPVEIMMPPPCVKKYHVLQGMSMVQLIIHTSGS